MRDRKIPARALCRVIVLFPAAIAFSASGAAAETPAVLFDIPFTVECRDVTPKGYEDAYKKKVIEAVFRISPQLVAGEESDLKKLHYEITSDRRTPVISYAPSSQVTSDVAGGTIAIQTSKHHGELAVRYFVTPAAGDGMLRGDLESSHAQYALLAPKQLLLAAGTIERGCGVYYELKPSTQDTLRKQRDFACLFEVPQPWRADHVTVKCNARGTKRGFAGLTESEVNCGLGMLSVGLYKQDDGEAKELADELARKQQAYLDRLTEDARAKAAKGEAKAAWLSEFVGIVGYVFSNKAVMKAKTGRTQIGSALQAQIAESAGVQGSLPEDSRAAYDEMRAVRDSLRKLNGAP